MWNSKIFTELKSITNSIKELINTIRILSFLIQHSKNSLIWNVKLLVLKLILMQSVNFLGKSNMKASVFFKVFQNNLFIIRNRNLSKKQQHQLLKKTIKHYNKKLHAFGRKFCQFFFTNENNVKISSIYNWWWYSLIKIVSEAWMT